MYFAPEVEQESTGIVQTVTVIVGVAVGEGAVRP